MGRVRNETILSSRGREGRCERVGVVFSPLRRLTSLRRDKGGSEPGAEVGRALLRWGPNASLEIVRGKGSVKLTKMTHLLSVRFPLTSRLPLYFAFFPYFGDRCYDDALLEELQSDISTRRGANRNKSQYAVKRIDVCVIRKVLRYYRGKRE